MRAQIVGISFAVAPGEAAYIPLRHGYAGAPDQLPVDAVLALLKPWLEDESRAKLGQNVKYDTHVFANAGITVRGYVHDTLLESYVLEAHKPHGLESLALRHLNRKGLSYEDLCGKGANQIPFAQVDIEQAARYSGEDSEMCLHVHRALWPQVEAEAGLRFVYEQIEMPTSRVLVRVERNGVLIDRALLAAQSRELAERMLALEVGGARARRPAVQPRQPQADRRDPVRQARPAGRAQDGERRALDRRDGAGEARRRLSAAGQAARAPRPGQAQGHLHRQAAADGQPRDRPRAHQLRAGGGGDGAAVEQRPEPAEHPDPHARGPARARGLHRAAGACHRERRLLADRAAHHGPHQRRRRPAARVRRGHRRAPRDGERGLRRAGARGQQRAAALRQGHQLRPHLRHGRVRPGEQPRHRAEGGARLHRALLRALRRRQALHGRDQAARRRARLRRDDVRPPHRTCPRSRAATARAAPAPSARPSTRRCRARRPT